MLSLVLRRSCALPAAGAPHLVARFTTSAVRSSPKNPVTLSKLADNPGARPKKTRVGRGPGSGLGKTSGRGMCGQRAREGGRRTNIFEGGQMPLFRKMPLIGFNSVNKPEIKPLNLATLASAIRAGKIDASQPIDLKVIHEANLVHGIKDGVKLLSKGVENFNTPNLHIRVTAVSSAARAAIEKFGGRVETVYYNRLGLRAHLQPYKFDVLPLNAAPPQRIALRFDTPQPFPAAPRREVRAAHSAVAPVVNAPAPAATKAASTVTL